MVQKPASLSWMVSASLIPPDELLELEELLELDELEEEDELLELLEFDEELLELDDAFISVAGPELPPPQALSKAAVRAKVIKRSEFIKVLCVFVLCSGTLRAAYASCLFLNVVFPKASLFQIGITVLVLWSCRMVARLRLFCHAIFFIYTIIVIPVCCVWVANYVIFAPRAAVAA